MKPLHHGVSSGKNYLTLRNCITLFMKTEVFWDMSSAMRWILTDVWEECSVSTFRLAKKKILH
jgi:hypothetical protein